MMSAYTANSSMDQQLVLSYIDRAVQLTRANQPQVAVPDENFFWCDKSTPYIYKARALLSPSSWSLMLLCSWSNVCHTISHGSCSPRVFCASIDVRSSRFTTSTNPRNAIYLRPNPLSQRSDFSTLSKYSILSPLRSLRRCLSEMYWAQGTTPTHKPTPVDLGLTLTRRYADPMGLLPHTSRHKARPLRVTSGLNGHYLDWL